MTYEDRFSVEISLVDRVKILLKYIATITPGAMGMIEMSTGMAISKNLSSEEAITLVGLGLLNGMIFFYNLDQYKTKILERYPIDTEQDGSLDDRVKKLKRNPEFRKDLDRYNPLLCIEQLLLYRLPKEIYRKLIKRGLE